jgi:hypothetical protein
MKKISINDTPCYETTLQINSSGWTRTRNITGNRTVYTRYWSYLLAILADQHVTVHIFSNNNISGKTNEKQLRKSAEILRETMDPVYARDLDEMIEFLVGRFGDGTLGINLTNADLVLSPNEIQALIDEHERMLNPPEVAPLSPNEQLHLSALFHHGYLVIVDQGNGREIITRLAGIGGGEFGFDTEQSREQSLGDLMSDQIQVFAPTREWPDNMSALSEESQALHAQWQALTLLEKGERIANEKAR